MNFENSQPGCAPAFPALVVEGGCDGIGKKDGVWHFPGLTVRQYFMARAPVEPQDWFQPVMPPAPVAPVMPTDFTNAESENYNGWRCDCLDLANMAGTPRVVEYINARDAWVTAQEVWNKLQYKERLIQWPAAWADAVLKAGQP